MSMSSEDQGLWDAIADELEAYIEERGNGESEMRDRYADIMAKNQYNNRDFETLVNLTFDNFARIEDEYARDEREPLEKFLPTAARDIVDGHFANSVISNRRTADSLDTRTFNEMEDMVRHYKQLVGGGRRTGRQGRGSDRDDGDRYYDNRDGRGGGGSGYSRKSRQPASSSGLARTSGGSSWRNKRDKGNARAAAGDHWTETAREVAETVDRQEAERRDTHTTSRPAATKTPVADSPRAEPVVAPRVVLEGPDYTKPRPYDQFVRNGELWRVAVNSGWTIPFNPNNPMASVPKLYDVRTGIKYHVQATNGTIREEIEPVTDDNRYLAHEALQQPEAYRATSNRRAGPAISLTAKPAEEDKLVTQETRPTTVGLRESLCAIRDTDFTIPADGAPLHETLEGLVFNTRMRQRLDNVDQRLNIGFRYTALATSGWKQEDLINRVFESHNLAAAAEALTNLKGEFDKLVWDELNNRFSELVLRAIRIQFQNSDVKKLSFATDWPKLIAHLESTVGEGVAADFAQRTTYIVAQACAIAAREDLSGFVGLGEAGEGQDLPMVAFLDYTTVIAVSGTLDGMGLGRQLLSAETGVSITATADHVLTAAVRAIYTKLEADSQNYGAGRLFIHTADGFLLELVPFAARKENFILALKG